MSAQLYSYFRSSTSYRVRIALNVKGVDYALLPINILKGEQKAADYAAINPSQGVPALVDGGHIFTQSLAILDYVEERWPTPALLPASAAARAQVRALTQIIGCDIHPVNNLRVLNYLTETLAISDAQKQEWMQHWLAEGLRAFEAMVRPLAGDYCFGNQVTLADICLVPQIFNAERFGHDLGPYPTIMRITEHCRTQDAFQKAHPNEQPDRL